MFSLFNLQTIRECSWFPNPLMEWGLDLGKDPLLTSRSKLGFINGSYRKLDLDSNEYQDWGPQLFQLQKELSQIT